MTESTNESPVDAPTDAVAPGEAQVGNAPATDPRATIIASKLLELNGVISNEPANEGAQAALESAAGVILSIFDLLLPIVVKAVIAEYDSICASTGDTALEK